jgi:hypothetical protein
VIKITLQLGGRIQMLFIFVKVQIGQMLSISESRIEISDGQWLPIVVKMGGRLIADVS